MSFTPNKKLVKFDTEVEINAECCVDDALLCWSPTLELEVYLDKEDVDTHYSVEETDKDPNPYSGSQPASQNWAILTHKSGDPRQVFWTAGSQFEMNISEDFHFISNDGLDIDPKHISSDYADITYDNGTNSWTVGSHLDHTEGGVELYSAVDSDNSTGVDEDGDYIYSPMLQEKFEAIKQLFQRAGFKVKVRRLPR